MADRAKPIFAYAIKTHGTLNAGEIHDFTAEGRADAIRYANRPAGQSVVKVRISEVAAKRRPRP